jgi:ribosomal protein S6
MNEKEIEHGTDGTELELEQGNNETRVYELGFHIDPELPQEEVKKTYQSIRERIAGQGTIIAEGEPEKIPLAYTISRSEVTGRRDFVSAYFAWIAYETTGEGHEDIARAAREESRVIRFLDLRTSREAAKHSEEVHEMMLRAAEGVEEEPEAPEAELDAALKEAGV